MVSGKYVYQITVFSKDEKWLYYSKEATKVSVKVDTIGDRNLIKEFSNIIFFSERNISNLLFNTGETLKDIIDEKQWTEIAVNEATDIFNELIIDKSIPIFLDK